MALHPHPRRRPDAGNAFRAWLAAFFGFASFSAGAEELNVQVTNSAAAEYRADNKNGNDSDDDYVVLIDRLNIQGAARNVTASARIDAFGFFFPPTEQYQTQLRLERAALRYRLGAFSLEVGDFYQILGRGLTLSVRKLQQAGVDVSLFGGKVAYNGEDHRLQLFAGRANTANMDPVSQRFTKDQRDILAGGNYELKANRQATIGFYGLYNQPEDRLLEESLDFTVSGGTYIDLSTLFEWMSAYLEVAVQERLLAGTLQSGSAAYLNTEARFFGFTLFFEGMLLNDYEQRGSPNSALGNRFSYNQPPTLERLDQEVLNSTNTVGGRARLEFFYQPLSILLYANAMARLNDPLDDNRVFQSHTFAGGQIYYDHGASRFSLAAGYRHEQQPAQPQPIKTILHLDVDLLHSLGWDFAAHLTTQTWFRTFEGKRYLFGSTFLGVERAGVGGVTLELGYDTFDPTPDVRNIYYALIGLWEVNEHFTLRSTVGTQRGGIKCVGGICRIFPAFAGARIELVSRF